MSRLQLALNVDDLTAAVDFYSTLFDTEPAKQRPGYANFAVADPPLKLVLIENPGHGGSLNHLGVEVEDVAAVDAVQARLGQHGLATLDERNTTCCYARQDKFWVEGAPSGQRWEVYTVLADSPTFVGPADADAGAGAGVEGQADAEAEAEAAQAGGCCGAAAAQLRNPRESVACCTTSG